MKQILRLTSLIAVLTLCLGSSVVLAQGSTTSAMNGQVVDANGEGIPGATVVAVHEPTGSRWGNISDLTGYFRMPNMNVGGPYTVTITFVGYEPFQQSGIFLTLGQTYRVSATLREGATELEEVVISGNTNDIFDGNRTGQQTVIDEQTINTMPTVSRSIGDFARLNPLANITEGGDGLSISLGGMNNRYNAIYIDGAVNNDVFGLAGSGTNGGQTGVSPISIDAIEQFQVSIAPFDVRQSGFAGGAINAVTRSGSNDVEGSAYYFVRNQDFAGKTPTDADNVDQVKLNDFSAKTYGFRLGGPIIKNKLFFFANAELQRDETPQPFVASTYEGDATTSDLQALESKLLNEYGYDAGGYQNNTAFLDSDKFLGRLDWNLSNNHKLTLRHSYTKADNLEAVQSNTRSIRYIAESEQFVSTTNSSALELKSTFGNNMSNSLIIGATFVRDQRDPYRDAINFPYVSIQDGSGRITFGSEQFSTANQLDQDVITITDNFELYKGKHTLTFGTHNEFYSTYNLFIRQNFGVYDYDSLSGFLQNAPAAEFTRSYSLVDNITGDGSAAAAAFTGMQLGFYVQDEYQVNDKLKVTAGIRMDVPIFNDDVRENPEFNSNTVDAIQRFGYDLNGATVGGPVVEPQIMLAPRFGFNYDVKGDKTTQIRGGLGIFNSRMPLVWWGGAYNNNGATVGGDNVEAEDLPTTDWIRPWDGFFNPEWDNQPQRVAPNSGLRSGQIDIFDPEMRLPQVFKTNIAVDQQLPWGLIGTAEFLYSKFLNNLLYSNYNLKPSNTRLTGTPDDRIIYNRFDRIDNDYSGNIYYGSNTNKGHTWNAAFTVSKPFENGFTANVSYSYGDAYTVYDGTSSQNSSQWRGLHTVNGRNGFNEAQRSNFAQGGRIIGQVSYRKEYAGFGASQFSFFYNGQAGDPYSYIYNDRGNLTNEDSREYSLIYVPASQDEIILVDDGDRSAAQQWRELDEFIESDDYLKDRRGQYAERNMNRMPWNDILDFRFLQDFYIETGSGKRNTLQLSVDIFNVMNLLNSDWGRIYQVGSFNNYELLDFEGFQADGTTPTFSFPEVENNEPWTNNIEDSGIRSSRWQMQIGLRYTFQ
ncbi:MAG: carboxypeptidase regulatory-like domain-containing protein [Cyclobacteriaceae bacterium]